MIRKNILGLEWGASGAKFGRLERVERKWVVAESGVCEWPEATRASTLAVDPLTRMEDLKDFVKRKGWRGRRVSLCVPRSEVFLKWVAPEYTKGAAVEWARHEFPYSLARLSWGHLPVVSATGQTWTILAGMPKDRAQRYLEAVHGAGLVLEGIGINFLAQLQAFRAMGALAQAKGQTAYLEIGEADTQFGVAERGGALFARSIPIGRCDILRRESWALEIINEVNKSRFYLQKVRRAQDFEKLYLFGGASQEGGLPTLLRQHLQVEVEETVGEKNNRFLGAYGQALAAAGRNETLWLIEPGRPYEALKKTLARNAGRIAAGLSLFGLASVFLLRQAADRNTVLLHALDRELRGRTALAAPAEVSGDAALPVLSEVMRRLPAKAHLLDFRYDALIKKVFLRGRAGDYAAVSDLVSQLSKGEAVRTAKAERANLIQAVEGPVVEFSVEGETR